MYKLILICNGQEVAAKADGYIGDKFRVNSDLELQIVIPVNSAVKPAHFVKHNNKMFQAELKANYRDENFRVHTAVFSVKTTASGYLRAVQNHNGKNFIVIDCGNGTVRKAGIVSQANKFYLLDREIQKEPEQEACGSDNLGVVEWFDVFSGVGCLRAKNGMIRFYWDCLLDETGLVEPKPGEWIVFARASIPQAATTFQREIASNAIRFTAHPSDEELRKAINRLMQMDAAAASNYTAPTLTAKLGEITGPGKGLP